MRVVFGAVVVWNLSYIAGFLGIVYLAVKSYADGDSTMLIISGLLAFGFVAASLLLTMGSYNLTEKKSSKEAEQ